MNRSFVFFVSVLVLSKMMAQRNVGFQGHPFEISNSSPEIKYNYEKAYGDTIFLFDGKTLSCTGPATTPQFGVLAQDIDQKTLDTLFTHHGFPAKASFVRASDPIAPGDTNFYFQSVSDFTPFGTANDWVSFGPIVIPAGGATLSWKHNFLDPAFRDGYKIWVNTVGLGSANFTGTPIKTINDNDASTVADTAGFPHYVFYSRSLSLAAYAGQNIYLAFQHTAVNQFSFLLDDVIIKKSLSTGVETEALSSAVAIYPNPSTGIFNINTGTSSKKLVEVYTSLGEMVYSKEYTSSTISIDLSGLSGGVYSLKVISSDNSIVVKEIVITK